MPGVTKLGPGQERYHLRAVGADGAGGEPPGRWAGSAAAAVGLSGPVTAPALRAALGGRHPLTEAGLRDARHPVQVPGFELTFGAPKSVSVLAGLAGERLTAEVDEAQAAAVAAVVGYLERSAARARRGSGAERRLVPVEGLLAAAFTHHTSRAGDPHLHTHLLVANLVRGEDGRWTALDATGLFVHARAAAALHAAHLRGRLTSRLGLVWARGADGTTQLAGIDPRVLRAFSRRRADVRARMAEHGATSARGARVAALTTRAPKDPTSTAQTLAPGWRARARALGLGPEALSELVGRAGPAGLSVARAERVALDLVAPEGPLSGAASFDRRDVLRELSERLVAGADVRVVERIADAVLASDLAVEVGPDRGTVAGGAVVRLAGGRLLAAAGEERRWAARAALEAEKEALEIGARLASSPPAPAGGAPGDAALTGTVEGALARRPGLSVADAAAVHRLAWPRSGIEVVSSSAWTDTAAVLDTAKDVWRAGGREVLAVGSSHRALAELEAQTGIAGVPLPLDGATLGRLAGSGCTLVVLEAHLLGARDVLPVLRAAAGGGGAVVLVADRNAVPPHDPGNLLERLAALAPPVELGERVAPARRDDGARLGVLRHGEVTLVPDALAAREQLVRDWWDHEGTGARATMVAPRRRDVAELNERARTVLDAAGVLSGPRLVVDARNYRAGDRLLVRRHDTRLGLAPGGRVAVTDVDVASERLSVRPEGGSGRGGADGSRVLDASRLRAGLLLHAYAVTPHDLRGERSGVVLLLGDAAQYRAAGRRGPPGDPGRRQLYAVVGAELASASQSVLRPLAVLAEERDRIDAALRAEEPPDPGASLAAARHEQTRAAAALDAAAARLRSVEEDAAAGQPAVQTPGDRWPVPPASVVATARADEVRWREHLGRLEEQTSTLARQAAARGEWEGERGPERARLAELDRAAELRGRLLARAAEVSEPAYLTAVLGPRPSEPHARQTWLGAASAVEAYRDRWAVDDTERAVGADPGRQASRPQRAQREAAGEIVRAAAEALGRAQDRGRDRSRVARVAVGPPALAR